MPGLTLDAGALMAFERNDRRVVALIARSLAHGYAMAVPAGVVGQVWRDGRRQARLARLLAAREVEIEVLDDRRARAAGQLCGVTGNGDVIDASVVLCAARADTGSPPRIRTISAGWTRRCRSFACNRTPLTAARESESPPIGGRCPNRRSRQRAAGEQQPPNRANGQRPSPLYA